jgi:hypothetical protein
LPFLQATDASWRNSQASSGIDSLTRTEGQMKNRDKWRGFRSQDVKVYHCRVLVANGKPTVRYTSATKAAAISR